MICISIPEKNIDKCLALINTADLAEIRIDMAEFDEADVRTVFSKAGKPLIAACRPELVQDAERIKLLKAAIESGAAYVDVEIESAEEIKQDIIQFAKSHNCKVIVSYHNHKNTPSSDELYKIIDSCFDSDADIVKIATTAQNPGDSARILGLYAKYTSLIALAMGEAGKISRIASVFLGSPFTFAAVSEKENTAPGQLTVSEMRSFLKI